MPKAYFEPQNLFALVQVFEDARALLMARGRDSEELRDVIATRIFDLAGQGTPPSQILHELISMSPADIGLPLRPEREILTDKLKDAGHA